MAYKVPTPVNYETQINKTQEEFKPFLFGMDTYLKIEAILGYIIIPSISLFSILANTVNIIVFVKMGFAETTNMMFLALSVSDLTITINYFLSALNASGVFDDINTVFYDMWDLEYILNPITWAFIGYGSCTTALIAVERSVCIALPLKVKTLFTPRRIAVALVGLFGLPLATLVQKYAVMELRWVPLPGTNLTRLAYVYTDKNIVWDKLGAFVFGTIPSLLSFIIVVVGTVFMVGKLRESARWRQASSQSMQKKAASAKEIKVVRSVVFICSVFIVCFTPMVFVSVTTLVYPPFHLSNPYFAPFVFTVFIFSTLMQTISASLNIFIYLRTSSKYKKIYVQIFLTFQVKLKS